MNKNKYFTANLGFKLNLDKLKPLEKSIDRKRGVIYKTPFKVLESYPNCPPAEYEDFVNGEYAYVNCKELMMVCSKIPPIAVRIMLFIASKLENNSNLAKCNMAEFHDIFSGQHKYVVYNKYIKELVAANVIARTNKRSVYIVNHNLVFKGDLNEFATKYRDLYGYDDKCDYDDKGNIII